MSATDTRSLAKWNTEWKCACKNNESHQYQHRVNEKFQVVVDFLYLTLSLSLTESKSVRQEKQAHELSGGKKRVNREHCCHYCRHCCFATIVVDRRRRQRRWRLATPLSSSKNTDHSVFLCFARLYYTFFLFIRFVSLAFRVCCSRMKLTDRQQNAMRSPNDWMLISLFWSISFGFKESDGESACVRSHAHNLTTHHRIVF